MLMNVCVVALGGALGAVGRYVLADLAQRLGPRAIELFPVGTLSVNVLGCLAIGVAAAYFAGPNLVREEVRLLLMVGILGGFTTFSTFGLETFELLNARQWTWAAVYIAFSNLGGFLAVFIGYRLTEKLNGV